MKKKILFLFLLSFAVVTAKPKEKITINPAIGLLMISYNQGDHILFEFKIKNIGEETLTNIYLTEAPNTSPINYQFNPITSLAPGQEITGLYGTKIWTSCSDESQTIVHATTSIATEITDLSADPNGYQNNNGQFGDYYSNNPTITNYIGINDFSGNQQGVYIDQNQNSIIDVGDVVNYIYNYHYGILHDDNAIIIGNYWTQYGYVAQGIHYLTQSDLNTGYVYNNSYAEINVGNPGGPCFFSFNQTLDNANPCFCPNPNNANIITSLTSYLPNQISGKVKFNANNDNCATGLNFPNRRVYTTDGSNYYSSYTNTNGDYHILIPNVGSFNTSALANLNPNFNSNPTSINITSSGNGVNYNNTDFCISSTTNYTDLSVNMFNINQAIPGNTSIYRIYYSNFGSTNLTGTIVLSFDNSKLTFVGTPTTLNSITWPYTNLLPFETRYIDVSFTVLTPPTVNTNDNLSFSVVANPTTGDNNPANNTYNFIQVVRSSFDPNDKTVIEGSFIDIGQTNNYLNYVTRFQNTGTANATTVVIKETLDTKLDWDTFEPIASSHNSNIQIRNGNEVTYTFSNINLPYESANEPASHGWMAYRIKPKSTIAVWDMMYSSSAIYFDYNPPIYTNTVSTQVIALGATNFIKNNFSVYPNPATNYITIEAKTNVDANYEIMDINGKSLLKGTIQSLQPINIATLQSGFYFVTIKTEQEKITYKLIKN
jgi:hypothetical protein